MNREGKVRLIQRFNIFIHLAKFLSFLALVAANFSVQPGLAAVSPGLNIVSGNGQVILEQFRSAPMIVQAVDAAGKPVANLPVTWAITQGKGTITAALDPGLPPHDHTDANGYASTYVVATAVDAGYSFQTATITASSSLGSVNFVLTYNLSRLPNGSSVDLPLVQLTAPTSGTLRGRAGDTLPAAIAIQVVELSGPQQGQPVPNVSLRIVDYNNPDNPNPPAACVAPTLTDANGVAKCDLVIHAAPGTYGIAAEVGEYRMMPLIVLTVDPGAPCTYALSPLSQSFPAAGGAGSISVAAGPGCTWDASANAPWISITAGASGISNGTVSFTVAPNSGAQRTGAISVGGQLFTITQAGAGSAGPLAIMTTSLPAAAVNTPYSAAISATGGRPPYSFSAAPLPPGLALNPTTGALTGSPASAGAYTFTVTVVDAAGGAAMRNLTLVIGAAPGGGNPVITTTFPAGTVGAPYSQALTSSGGCSNPFSVPRFELAGGSLPTGLSITNSDRYYVSGIPTAAGVFNFSLKVTDPCGRSSTSNFSVVITANSTGGSLTAAPTSLVFSMVPGGALPADQTIAVSGSSGLSYAATASTTSGGNWLAIVSGASGTVPGAITVRVANAASLASGSYSGLVSITSNAGTTNVQVTLNVAPVGSPLITASPPQLEFAVQAQSRSLRAQGTLSIASSGAPIHFTVRTYLPIAGNWLTVSPAEADTPSTVTVAIDATGLAPSVYFGWVLITPGPGGGSVLNVLVTLRVNMAPVLAASVANLEFAVQGSGNPAAQVVNVTSAPSGTNITASATTGSGGAWLSVTPASAQTPAALTISADAAGLSPGSYRGMITITSPVEGVAAITIPVTLTIPQNAPSIAAVVNAGSFLPGPIAPGEILVITGAGLGPASLATMSITNGLIERTLSGVKVFFDGVDAPLIYASATQLAAIVPYEIAGRAVTRLVVQYQGSQSQAVTLNVVDAAPGLFLVATGRAAALNQDSSVNAPDNPAAPGSVVVLYATGEGMTTPAAVTGQVTHAPFDQLPRPRNRVSVTVGGKDATVLYAGAAPGMPAGIMQVNAVIPPDIDTGPAVPVTVAVGNASSPPALIYVSQ